ncbi:helix-turn-helix domain-containing protein [Halalkalibacter kiskunsagensis]|uniref:helix-turn-helix domain-containing protein n=1 Tax=Halalkalibacter kiskunsagensis TaxID=1548599 RepID=UPI00300A9681
MLPLNTRLSKTFRRYLISYIIILLFPLITGIISYQVSMDVAKESSIESSELILNKSKEILEGRITEIDRFTRQLAIYDFNQHLIARLDPKKIDMYSLIETSRFISTYAHSNDFLEDFYIYFNNYDAVLKGGSVYFRADHFYEIYHYNDLSYDQWKKNILEANHQGEILPLSSYTSNKKELSVISYVQSLPFNSFDQPLGTAVVTIDQQQIGVLLEGLSKQYGGWAFVADKEGHPLTMMGIGEVQTKEIVNKLESDTDSSPKIIDNETMLLSIQSDFNGWHYVAGIPKQGLMKKAESIKQITWIVTGSTLVVGILLCLFLAYRDSTPINNLMNVVKDQFGSEPVTHKNEFDFLHGNISKLITNHQSLENELTNQNELLKDSFIKSLLNGEVYSQKGISERAEQLQIFFKGEFGYVGILKINGYGDMENKEIHKELSSSRFIIKRALKELEPTILMTDLHSDKIVFILTFHQEKVSNANHEVKRLINALTQLVEKSYRISVSTYIGKAFKSYQQISRSYYEARQVLDFTFTEINESKISWYQDIVKETRIFYYPIDLELRLINLLRAGETNDIKEILKQIFQENFYEKELSPQIVEQLLEQMKSTLIKAFYSDTYKYSDESKTLIDKVLQIQLNLGIEQVWKRFECIVDEYCSLVNKRKKETNDHSVKLIIELLEENYGDSDLSLYRISEKIGLPEKFVSQLFKEQLGEYLSDYIEKLRITKASELLITTDLTIEEISVKVGYNSAHSFRRAFKRVLNVTPKVYRQATNPNDEGKNI